MILNGAGDPRTLSPIPDGTNDKLYVDDLTGAVYSAVGFPPTWTPVTPPLMPGYDATNQSANVAQFTLFTPTLTGYYEVAGCFVVTQAATTSSTLPQGILVWTDPDSNVTTPATQFTATYAGNVLGGTNVAGGANSRVIHAKGGSPVLLSISSYASSGATPMLFAVHVRAILISN